MLQASGRGSRGGGVHEIPRAAGPLDVDPLKDANGESITNELTPPLLFFC